MDMTFARIVYRLLAGHALEAELRGLAGQCSGGRQGGLSQ